ncbi:hypothetical protein QBC41DRAFT_393796 [Cercophora samala]|uniref:Uncharacterized protein n=1 Tax=Cercophora samala TaxID=330535 RepID=A0AA39ZCT4_9PEZI|nr:hypothetical protein QBC41DRAFT_393796 [Cercophora samala]
MADTDDEWCWPPLSFLAGHGDVKEPREEDPAFRLWEKQMARGRTHLGRSQLELALQCFTSALHLCETNPCLDGRKYLAVGNIGWVNRLLGRYARAAELLQQALSLADSLPGPPPRERGILVGELGTLYRQTDRHEEAREMFASQHSMAEKMGWKAQVCRAIGNMGMANCQLARQTWEARTAGDQEAKKKAQDLTQLALGQLKERVSLALEIQKEENRHAYSHETSTRWQQALSWEIIGLSRISLCYMTLAEMEQDDAGVRGDLLSQAHEVAKKAAQAAEYGDTASLPLSQFFHGRVHLMMGQKAAAIRQFNAVERFRVGQEWFVHPTTTPAVALCKEPSVEHRAYLGELVDAGADFDLADPEGYTPLDHAIFSGDAETEAIVVDALQRQFGDGPSARDKIAERLLEAQRRKGYREIFQERLRPLLAKRDMSRLRAADKAGEDGRLMAELRKAYASALASGPTSGANHLFDHLKVMRYTDFVSFGRLPRSSDGLVRRFDPDAAEPAFVIFFSYRWIGDGGVTGPDDATNTQYRRMVHAVEAYLVDNPMERSNICIWMDYACVDQDDPAAGVSSLPIIIAQSDVVISLQDDEYYDRAWCCVEALMIQTLVLSYRLHQWYEQIPAEDELGRWELRKGKPVGSLGVSKKKLSFEADRTKIVFLERQVRLLGRSHDYEAWNEARVMLEHRSWLGR